jgi:uncharacterized protein (TIRG00374 family)
MMAAKRWKPALGSWVRIVLSLGLLAFVLRQVGWEQVWQAVRQAHGPYLTAALALSLAGIVVRAYRWGILLRALDIQPSLGRLTALYFVGTFFNNFLPTGVGGDVVRVYELAQESKRPAAAIGTVLLDRASGLLVLFLIALLALAFGHTLVSPQIAAAIVLLFVAGWGGSAFVLQRNWLQRLGLWRWVEKIDLLRRAYEAVTVCGGRAIGGALGVSLGLNVVLIAMNVLIAQSLGIELTLWYYLLFVPIISFLLVLPVSLSGLGVREGGYVYLFGQAGVPAHLALSLSLVVYTFVNVVPGVVGAAVYAWQGLRGLRHAED